MTHHCPTPLLSPGISLSRSSFHAFSTMGNHKVVGTTATMG